MDFGYLSVNTADGIRPDRLAVELEGRGFESLWLPEHTHIPTSRRTPYGTGEELPEGYVHMMNPFVSLASAATATTSLRLGTGMCIVLEHDILDLAVTAATLDVLSGGRFILGVAAGWNAEELANHQPDLRFGARYSAMAERVSALRAAWASDPASFDGEHVRFSESWIHPKPLGGSIPIALGNAGPIGQAQAAALADDWCPLSIALVDQDGRYDPVAAIRGFRDLVAATGRDPETVRISVFCIRLPRLKDLDLFVESGVDRVVFFPKEMTRHPATETLRQLDEVAILMKHLA